MKERIFQGRIRLFEMDSFELRRLQINRLSDKIIQLTVSLSRRRGEDSCSRGTLVVLVPHLDNTTVKRSNKVARRGAGDKELRLDPGARRVNASARDALVIK